MRRRSIALLMLTGLIAVTGCGVVDDEPSTPIANDETPDPDPDPDETPVGDLVIVNESDEDIIDWYASLCGQNNWTEDLLPTGSIRAGSEVRFRDLPAACWDFDFFSQSYYWAPRDIAIPEDDTYELTLTLSALHAAREADWFGAPAPGPAQRPDVAPTPLRPDAH